MSIHEKDLLIISASFLMLSVLAALFVSIIVEMSVFAVMLSVYKTMGWRFIIFVFPGLGGLYYEFTTINHNLRIIETTYGRKKPLFAHKAAIGGSLSFIALWLTLTLLTYMFGNEEAVLKLSYRLMAAGGGFFLVVVIMFAGAVLARLVRRA